VNEKKILILIIAIGIFVRIFPIPYLNSNSGVLSSIHGLTKVVAATEIFHILRILPGDIGPILFPPQQSPLRPIILYCFMFLGRNEFILRLPSLLFGIGCLFLIYQLGRLFFGTKVGLLSAFLLSVSLWHIKSSSLPDMYTLFVFLSLLSVFFFYKTLKEYSVGSQIKFILFSILAFYSFYPIITIIFIEFLWVLLFYRHDRKKMSIFGVSLAIIMALILPGLVTAFSYLWTLRGVLWGWISDETLQNLSSLFGGIRNFFPINIFIFLFGLLATFFRKTEREKCLFLGFLIIFPIVFFLSCFLFFKTSLAGRYFLIIYPFFIILSSYAILSVKNKILIILLLLIFNSSSFLFALTKIGFDTARYIPRDYLRYAEDFKSVADYLKDNYKEGDAVVIGRTWQVTMIQYYLDINNCFPVKKMQPLCGAHWYLKYDGNKVKHLYGLDGEEGQLKRFKKIWKEHKRLFLIDANYVWNHLEREEMQKWINENYSEKMDFFGGSIYVFEDDKSKKALIKEETYQCSKMICYLDCEAKAYEIRYPFEKVRSWLRKREILR
jgi:hypothetical protein